jgi:hypothetical protein
MTTNNAAASQLKLNVTNIKSVLVKGNKSMTRLKAFKAKTIFNMEQDDLRKKEEESLEAVKPKKKKITADKSPVKSKGGILNKLMTFAGNAFTKTPPNIIPANVINLFKIPPLDLTGDLSAVIFFFFGLTASNDSSSFFLKSSCSILNIVFALNAFKHVILLLPLTNTLLMLVTFNFNCDAAALLVVIQISLEDQALPTYIHSLY